MGGTLTANQLAQFGHSLLTANGSLQATAANMAAAGHKERDQTIPGGASGVSAPFGGLNAATMNLALGLAGAGPGAGPGPSLVTAGSAASQANNLNAHMTAAQAQQLVLPTG